MMLMTLLYVVVAFVLGIWAGAGWATHEYKRLQHQYAELQHQYAELQARSRQLLEKVEKLLERKQADAANRINNS